MRHLPTTEVVCEKLFGNRGRTALRPPRRRRARKRLNARAGILILLLLSALGGVPQVFAGTPAQTPTPAATPTVAPTTTRTATASPTASPDDSPVDDSPADDSPADDPAASPTQTPAATTTASPVASGGEVRVIRAYRVGRETPPAGVSNVEEWKRDSMTAGLNQIIIVEVLGLRTLLNRAKCLDSAGNKIAVPATCREKNILLFIEGRPLRGMKPESGAPELKDGENGTLRYHLQRPPETETENYADSKEHWADLLGLDSIRELFVATRDVSLSVGLEDEYPVASDIKEGNKFHLLRVHLLRLLFWAILLLACLYIFYRLARDTDIIRDRKPVLWNQRKPYSLSRTQAAWWFFFVVIGFIFIWLVTGQRDLSPSVLVLLGIGFATAIGSTVIDQNRSAALLTEETVATGELTTLLQEKDALEQELTDLKKKLNPKAPADNPQAQAAFDAKQQQYGAKIKEIRTKFPDALGWKHIRFRIDILSDAHGVNFHRFQMVIWTVVLGLVFIHEVLSRLAMPEFSTTLLTLMGISNGTYLIGKTSEPQGTSAAQPAGDAGDGDGADGTSPAGTTNS